MTVRDRRTGRRGHARRRTAWRPRASRRTGSCASRARTRCGAPDRARGPTARRPTSGRSACRAGGSAAISRGQRLRLGARLAARRPRGWRGRSGAPRRRATGRPVRMRSSARPMPMMRGSRMVPPSMSGTPQRRQNTPNTASSSTTRRSHHSASSSPPATAWPATAAITGFESSMRDGPIGPSVASRRRRRRPWARDAVLAGRGRHRLEVGAGAEGAVSPNRTPTRASSSASKARKASASASAVARSTALRTCGRRRITVVTGPFFSVETLGSLML